MRAATSVTMDHSADSHLASPGSVLIVSASLLAGAARTLDFTRDPSNPQNRPLSHSLPPVFSGLRPATTVGGAVAWRIRAPQSPHTNPGVQFRGGNRQIRTTVPGGLLRGVRYLAGVRRLIANAVVVWHPDEWSATHKTTNVGSETMKLVSWLESIRRSRAQSRRRAACSPIGRIEKLEDRTLLSVFSVNSTADTVDAV